MTNETNRAPSPASTAGGAVKDELLAEIQLVMDLLADTKMKMSTYISAANVLHHCRDAILGRGRYGEARSAGDAVPKCPHCSTHEVALARICHNSACTGYASEETIYEGWRGAAPAPGNTAQPSGKEE